MTLRFGIDCGKPRLPFLPLEDAEKAKAIADKIDMYVAMAKAE